MKKVLSWNESFSETFKNNKFNLKSGKHIINATIIVCLFILAWFFAGILGKNIVPFTKVIILGIPASIFLSYFVPLVSCYCPKSLKIESKGFFYYKYPFAKWFLWNNLAQINIIQSDDFIIIELKDINGMSVSVKYTSKSPIEDLLALINKYNNNDNLLVHQTKNRSADFSR